MKKIQSKITVMVVAATVCVSLLIGGMGMSASRHSTLTAIEKNLRETAELGALAAQNMISTYTLTIAELASNPILLDSQAAGAEKQAFIQSRVEAYYMRFGGMADAGGYDAVHNVDISSEPFYQAAMRGESCMSEPYIDGNDAYLMVSAPVMDGGAAAGVVYFQCDTYILQSIVESIQVGDKGEAYVLDAEGTVIACVDQQAVLERTNLIRQAPSSGSKDLQAVAAVERRMVAGETGVMECAGWIQGYAPIEGTGGWSIAVKIDKAEFMRSASLGNLFMAILCVVSCLVVGAVAVRLSRSISEPIVKCANRLRALSEGDLKSPVPQVRTQDETRVLSDSTAGLVSSLGQIMEEIGQVLGAIAGGDLTRKSTGGYYPGDFAVLQEHLQVISGKLNQTMSGIVLAARQVSSGSEQVAATGAALSQSSQEQAGAVEQLSATVAEMDRDARKTARLAEQGKSAVNGAGAKLQESGEYIRQLNEAMGRITASSNEISRIIETIENLAFQTNILALNAAVEAARAGTAGRGFAVVADEVRNLATKSDQAAKATQELIRRSVDSVVNGSQVVEMVTASVTDAAALAGQAVEQMELVSGAVEEQTVAMGQAAEGISQISGVVQSNSATAEQSAAASQELSSQADILKRLVGAFQLRD